MPWLRFNDKTWGHPKVQAAWQANPGSIGLWLMASSWTADYQQDGHVPDAIVNGLLDGAELAQILVTVGLMHEDTERGGWMIHDFLDYNPSKAETDSKREEVAVTRKEAGAAGGRAKAANAKQASSKPLANAYQTPSKPSSKPLANPSPEPEPEPEPIIVSLSERRRERNTRPSPVSERNKRRLGLVTPDGGDAA